MRLLFVTVAVGLAACGLAQAEPIHLACTGDLNAVGRPAEKYVLSMTIDMEARTVTVHGFDTVPMLGDTSSETVVFIARPEAQAGVSTGTVNRTTGAAQVHIISKIDGLLVFRGVCKPAQRLF